MEETKPTYKLNDFQQLLFLLKKYSKPYWKSFCLLMAVSFSVAFFTALLPLIFAPILDILLGKGFVIAPGGQGEFSLDSLNLKNMGAAVLSWLGLDDSYRSIIILCVIYLIVGCLKSLCNFGSYLSALWVRVRTARDMQFDLYRHILTLSLGFFTKQRTGELMSRMETDTTATTYGFDGIIRNIIQAPVLIVFYGVLLVRTSPKLALSAVVLALMHYGVTKGIQKPIRRYVADQFSALAELKARLQEAIQGIRIVKTFSAEKRELFRFKDSIRNLVVANMKFGIFKHVQQPTRSIVNHFVETCILMLGAYQVLSKQMEFTTFVMFIYVCRAITKPISSLGNTLTVVQSTLAASERVLKLFSERPKVADGAETISNFKTSIKLADVSFSYDNKIAVLSRIDLEVNKGEIVALVGPSGAGKSTLADLILRFYDPTSGEITIDGENLKEFKQTHYRRLFGMVPQEPLLFNATIRENIAYGMDDPKEDAIIHAAKIANAHEFILELPNGYDTLVGDRGIRLSGGQRQRVAIARALVYGPEIILLDEATSSLDSESEKQVQQAIDRVIESNTGIVIAHRLSTIINADKIVVMDQGRILDQGRHSDLLERCSLYRKLCKIQFDLEGGDTMDVSNSLKPPATGPIAL